MIEAKIICDSLAPSGIRLTTFVLTYPRFIHAEFMTHRMFSRNASSSRAIPVKKQIQMVLDNPAIPLEFRKNQKGMQAGELLEDQQAAVDLWLAARDVAAEAASMMEEMEIHKQYANRILEPYSHITVVCTATDFNNFFALRYHSAAQPEICELAKQMYALYSTNEPDDFVEGELHIPFISQKEKNAMTQNSAIDDKHGTLIKQSVARCARVSYLTHEGKNPTIEEDLALYERLVGAAPIHASPAEHQAIASSNPELRSGNFRGWVQYRKTLPNENITEFQVPTDEM